MVPVGSKGARHLDVHPMLGESTCGLEAGPEPWEKPRLKGESHFRSCTVVLALTAHILKSEAALWQGVSDGVGWGSGGCVCVCMCVCAELRQEMDSGMSELDLSQEGLFPLPTASAAWPATRSAWRP